MCPGCGRPFRVLPSSPVVYDSKFCAWNARAKPDKPTRKSMAEEQRLNPNGWRQSMPRRPTFVKDRDHDELPGGLAFET